MYSCASADIHPVGGKSTFYLSFSGCWRCSANGRSQTALHFLHRKENAPRYGNRSKNALRRHKWFFLLTLVFIFTPYETTNYVPYPYQQSLSCCITCHRCLRSTVTCAGAELGGCQGGHCPPKILPGPPKIFHVTSCHCIEVLHRPLTAPLVAKLAPPVAPPNENVWLRPCTCGKQGCQIVLTRSSQTLFRKEPNTLFAFRWWRHHVHSTVVIPSCEVSKMVGGKVWRYGDQTWTTCSFSKLD